MDNEDKKGVDFPPSVSRMGVNAFVFDHTKIDYETFDEMNYTDLPAIQGEDTNLYEFLEYFTLDDQIKELSAQMVERTAVNREWLFYNDDTCVNVGQSMSDAIYGNGVLIETQNEDVKSLLKFFFKNLNGSELRHRRYSLPEFIRDGIFSNMIHGEALFVKRVVGENNRLGIFPIDVKTTVPLHHDFYGYKKYTQMAFVESDLPGVVNDKVADKKEDIEAARDKFYSEEYQPKTRAFMYDRRTLGKVKPIKRNLPETHLFILNLFKKPLIDPLMESILNKKHMLYLMRKATEKFAGPLLLVKVGTPEAHPQDPTEYISILDTAAVQAAAARYGDSLAIPFNWDVKNIDVSARNFDFVAMIEWVNKTIIQGLGSSMDFYQSFGNTLGMSSIIHDLWVRRINTIRNKFEDILFDMSKAYLTSCDKQFKDYYPNKISKEEFEITWAPLREDDRDRVVSTIIQLLTSNILKDPNEARQLLREQGIFDLKELTPEKANELKEQQNQAMGGGEEQSASGSGKKYRFAEKTKIGSNKPIIPSRPQMTRMEKELLDEEYKMMEKIFEEKDET